jgi:hypothetical protein
MSGHFVYDFFMGACLHPRLGPFDLKFFAEIRISWFLLFINTVRGVGGGRRVTQHPLAGELFPSRFQASCAYQQWVNAESPTLDIFDGFKIPKVPLPMLVMLTAHFLYANACAKGEHYV